MHNLADDYYRRQRENLVLEVMHYEGFLYDWVTGHGKRIQAGSQFHVDEMQHIQHMLDRARADLRAFDGTTNEEE